MHHPRTARVRAHALPVLAALAALAPALPAPAQQKPVATVEELAAEVNALADEWVAARLQRSPEIGTMENLPDADHGGLTDNSLGALAAWHVRETAWAERLQRMDPDRLWGRPEWVTFGFLQQAVEASRATRVCRSELWPVNQMSGWQVSSASLAARQPVGTPALREQAIRRWSTLPEYLETEVENLREGLRRGYTTPRRNVHLVVEQLDALLALAPESHPLHSPAARDDDPAFRARWAALLADEITPAIRAYRDFLRDEYAPRARETIGITGNPDGAACYRAALRAHTTLERTGEEVFRDGLRAVAEREARTRELGERVYGTTDLDEIRARRRADTRHRFADRDEILAFSREVVERARAVLPEWFGTLPRAEVVIEPVPEFQERSTFSHYRGPSEDGTRPGTYFIKLYDPEGQDRGAVEVTAYHEAYPGHHLQIAIARERAAAHRITRMVGNSGFSEGWGRYAEQLADEMGLYATDEARLALWSGLPTGMVVDPGIHALGWSREQAMAYTLDRQGSWTEEDAAAYVDRIAVWPGQMVTYGVGEREILALRERARTALGERFDIRRFHDVVLGDGSVTLPMLHHKVDRWIDAER